LSVRFELPYESVRDRALLELRFETEGPIHLGSGESGISKKVLKIYWQGKKHFFIPSNSVKGVFRQIGTRIAKSMRFDEVVQLSLNEHTKAGHNFGNSEKIKDLEKNCSQQAREFVSVQQEEEERYELLSSLACPICRLFGSRYFSSKLMFSDSLPETSYIFDNYTSVAMQRKTKVAEPGRLYTSEFIHGTDKIIFNQQIVADNLSGTNEGKVFSNLIKLIVFSGVKVGGMKSRGYGLLTVDQSNSKVKLVNFKMGKELNEYQKIRKLLFKDDYMNLSLLEYAELIG
jgi:CRISPR/Cas system CSM-associated protein Csm3 (group 7 of RAMP superfamily)